MIYNPSAGKGRAGTIATTVERTLAQHGFEVESHATQGSGEAMAIARRCTSQVDAIIAIGGDGTVNEVVNGMAGPATAPANAAEVDARPTTLGIVPAGTVNVLARELGVPFRVERACDVIIRGKTASLDVGRANGRGFVLMMGAGVDALTVRNVDPRVKRRYRELAFIGAGLRHGFAHRSPQFLVRANGREHRATFFVAGNSRYYAGRLSITRSADPTDGHLDLLLFTGTGRRSLAVFWLEVPSGLHLHNRNVTCIRSDRVELVPLDESETVWFQTDGELAGRLPATVEIDRHAIEVLVP